MSDSWNAAVNQSLSLPMRLLLLVAGLISILAGPVLYLFPRGTSVYFAWTIENPLTPVFMGAAYLTAGVGLFLALRSNAYPSARQVLPAVIVFAVTQLTATLLHLNVFNWAHPVAWAWLAVYVTSPVAAVSLFLIAERRYSPVPPGPGAADRIIAWAMAALALAYGITGLALFTLPAQIAPLWPWALTPLTARVVGGWLLTVAALAWMVFRGKRLQTSRVVSISLIVFAVLQLAGAVSQWPRLQGPLLSTFLYLAALLALGGIALTAWWAAARQPSPPIGKISREGGAGPDNGA